MDYCVDNKQCGPYQPSRETGNSFDLNSLAEKVENPFQIIYNWIGKLEQIGSICSVIVVLMTAFSCIYKLYRIFLITCKTNNNIRQALKIELLPTPVNELNSTKKQEKQKQTEDIEIAEQEPLREEIRSWN